MLPFLPDNIYVDITDYDVTYVDGNSLFHMLKEAIVL